MEPNNWWFVGVSPFPRNIFRFHVSFRGCTHFFGDFHFLKKKSTAMTFNIFRCGPLGAFTSAFCECPENPNGAEQKWPEISRGPIFWNGPEPFFKNARVGSNVLFFQITLLKTNTSLLKTGALPQKERILSQSAIFTGELLVSGMEASFWSHL